MTISLSWSYTILQSLLMYSACALRLSSINNIKILVDKGVWWISESKIFHSSLNLRALWIFVRRRHWAMWLCFLMGQTFVIYSFCLSIFWGPPIGRFRTLWWFTRSLLVKVGFHSQINQENSHARNSVIHRKKSTQNL